MEKMTKKEAEEKIDIFFKQKNFDPKEVKKIKRLAMKHRIRLGNLRRNFCKNCFNKLRGEMKIGKDYVSIVCGNCRTRNRWKIN